MRWEIVALLNWDGSDAVFRASVVPTYFFFIFPVRNQQHPRVAAAAAAPPPLLLLRPSPLRSLSSRMPDMQTEADATILKHSTA